MTTAYLLTGGNLGNPQETLAQAAALITQKGIGKITAASFLYQTQAWGKHDQPDFLNQVLQLQTALSPKDLLQHLLDVEVEMGRLRFEKNGPRLIDIDILFYGDSIINEPQLTIPHPLLHLRRFVLVPLVEVAADLWHPVLNKTISQLLEECPDPLHVNKFSMAG